MCVTAALGLLLVLGFAQTGLAQTQLNFFNNYFVTGDYVVGGVGLQGLGVQGYATGYINIPDQKYGPATGVPAGADIIAALLYWQTVESSPTKFTGQQGFFRGYPITGSLLGDPNAPASWSSGGCCGLTFGPKTMRTYRADVRPYLQVDATGNVQPNISYQVRLADSGSKWRCSPSYFGCNPCPHLPGSGQERSSERHHYLRRRLCSEPWRGSNEPRTSRAFISLLKLLEG